MNLEGSMLIDSEPSLATATLARNFHPVSCSDTCTVTPLVESDSTRMPLLTKWSHPGAFSCQRTTPFLRFTTAMVGGRFVAGIFFRYIAATNPMVPSAAWILAV